ncbi:hypothetical protein ACLOJK_001282 [Asimina triloba]
MKKNTFVAKYLDHRNRPREFRDGNSPLTAILSFFCLSLAILGFFISFHARKLVISEQIFFHQMDKPIPFSNPSVPFSAATPLCNTTTYCPSPCQNDSSIGLEEWVGPHKEAWHSMNDDELMWRASMVPLVAEYPYNRTAKVAFLFLTRGALPLAPIWERFFKGHDGLFSIYLHASSLQFNEEPPQSSVFFKRRIPSKPVDWGKASMIDAERRLLANALLDFSNERFVLLSESCIPVFNFTAVYNYLIHSNQTFVGSFDDPRPRGRGRYNQRMWPLISINDWRKGSQWFQVNRKIAVVIVADRVYYPVFQAHCRPPCYMDEHYIPTLVTKRLPELNSNRSLTWVDWSGGGSHPASFKGRDVTLGFLTRIRHESKCTCNGNASDICVLFARKFEPSTLEPILRIAPGLFGFDP